MYLCRETQPRVGRQPSPDLLLSQLGHRQLRGRCCWGTARGQEESGSNPHPGKPCFQVSPLPAVRFMACQSLHKASPCLSS